MHWLHNLIFFTMSWMINSIFSFNGCKLFCLKINLIICLSYLILIITYSAMHFLSLIHVVCSNFSFFRWIRFLILWVSLVRFLFLLFLLAEGLVWKFLGLGMAQALREQQAKMHLALSLRNGHSLQPGILLLGRASIEDDNMTWSEWEVSVIPFFLQWPSFGLLN